MGLWDWQSAFMEGKGIANEFNLFIRFYTYHLMKDELMNRGKELVDLLSCMKGLLMKAILFIRTYE